MRTRKRIEVFCFHFSEHIEQDTLTSEEWTKFSDVKIALEPYKAATKDLQSNATDGRLGSVWERLPTVEFLLKHMEEGLVAAQAKYGDPHPHAVAWQNSGQKLDKWWHTTDDAQEVYAAATLLAPRDRKAYFIKRWTDKSYGKEGMIRRVRQYW